MFTGIVTDIGRIRRIERAGDTRFTIETGYDTGRVDIGASIACAGVCLTVVDKGPDWFAVTASAETLARSTLGAWSEGSPVNLERSLRVGDELGGHIVAGHVDGVGTIVERRPEGGSVRLTVELPTELAAYVAPKGSIALDGVSLTVNEVAGRRFGCNIIPHTQQVTTFAGVEVGARVNVEVDVLARYVARLTERESE